MMNKKYFLFFFFLVFTQFSLEAITKEEYLKEFQELDNASPEHACLEQASFDSCEKLMYEFGKPIYLEKIRAIVNNSKDINILKRYLNLEIKLPVQQSNFSERTKIIEKLRKIGTKDALFIVYQSSHNLDDLENLANKIGDSGQTGNHELMREYYIRKVKNLKQLPQFLEKFKAYKTKRFKEKALAFLEFGKNLTIDNFFNSIEYKYVLKELGFTLKHRSFGRKYDVILTSNIGNKSIVFPFNANCNFSKNITRRENVGFLEIFGTGGATEKDVSYSVDECTALQSQDKNKIYNLYASANQLSAFTALKADTWTYRTKTGQSYIAKVASPSKDMKNSCLAQTKHDDMFCYGIKNEDMKNSCLAQTKHDDMFCYGIKNEDMKNSCLAQTKHDDMFCYGIKNEDMKNSCLAQTKHDDMFCYGIKNENMKNSCLAQTKHDDMFCYGIKE